MITSSRPHEDLSSLLDRCGTLKARVVEFARNEYRPQIQAKLSARASSTGALSEWEVAGSIEDVIHEKDEDGQTLLDDFAQRMPELSDEDRATVLGWRESLWGVFEVHGHEGPVLATTNLVDGLDYRLATTVLEPKAVERLGRPGFLVTRIDRLGELWMFSGMQSLFKPTERRMAFGMAAQIAMERPSRFFRNPTNLENGRAADRRDHEAFLAHFRGAWMVDTPSEVERRHSEYLQLRGGSPNLQLRLPAELHEAETVGAFSDPMEGVSFFPHARELMSALENPSALRDAEIREVVFNYLDTPGNSPVVFRQFEQHCPDLLNAMMAELLNRPGFDWARDGEALLRERNPSFLERKVLPTNLPMSAELADGARAWQERKQERQVVSKRPTSPKQRDKRKQTKAARRKNRR